jgi:hypothetical protein
MMVRSLTGRRQFLGARTALAPGMGAGVEVISR